MMAAEWGDRQNRMMAAEWGDRQNRMMAAEWGDRQNRMMAAEWGDRQNRMMAAEWGDRQNRMMAADKMGKMRMCVCGCRTCTLRVLMWIPDANYDPTTNPDPFLNLSLMLIINHMKYRSCASRISKTGLWNECYSSN